MTELGERRAGARLTYLDVAKGIAMICIVLGHMGSAFIERVVFPFHVPIFYLITGYFISTKRPMREFVARKARTLLVPYVLLCAVLTLLICLKTHLIGGDTLAVFKEYLLASFWGSGSRRHVPFEIPSIGALWFLLACFWGSVFLRAILCLRTWMQPLAAIALLLLGDFTSWYWLPFSIQAGAGATLFMYVGYVLRRSQDTLRALPREAKVLCGIGAVAVWASFIYSYESFWLVSSNVGRGGGDILSCLCACGVVLWVSKRIDERGGRLGRGLAYLGTYSLIMLGVHILEMRLVPWSQITGSLVAWAGLSTSWELLALIVLKIPFDIACTVLLSKVGFVRRAFGMK